MFIDYGLFPIAENLLFVLVVSRCFSQFLLVVHGCYVTAAVAEKARVSAANARVPG